MGACLSAPKTGADGIGLQPGTVCGEGRHAFRVIKPIGAGSWAACYLVERLHDGKHYALKRTSLAELSETEKWVAVNEVRLLASLHHRNVVQYRHCFVEGGHLHAIMELVPHGELAAVIEQHRREQRRIPEDLVWGYLLQVAVGLQYLHAAGIIHRDIKPANILLGHEGLLKIADLGVAGLLHMGSSKLAIGTPQYMAPEMHAGREYSYAADVWSLGCLAYELCALEPLYQDRDEEVVARKVLATALPPAIPAKYSPDLQIVINRMLQQDPQARPSVPELIQLPQLQKRLHLMPAELEEHASMGSLSLDCCEGVPVLPAIEVPEDLQELNQRLPASRYSFDSMDDEVLDLAAKFGAPAIRRPSTAPPRPSADIASANAAACAGAATAAAAAATAGGQQEQQQQQLQQPAGDGGAVHPHLPRISSPVTVLEEQLLARAASSADTPCGTGGAAMGAVEAAVAAALLEEERMGAPAGCSWAKGRPVSPGAAAWADALNARSSGESVRDGAYI